MSKSLVACFSATGVTWSIAQAIASLVSADLFRIAPKTPYSQEDLNWNDRGSRSSVEMRDSASRPEIAGKVEDMAAYQFIFLGFPIWWYEPPHIIFTFLESYDFAGKTIFPFVTSGGSGLGKIPQSLKTACPDACWGEGRRFTSLPDKNVLENWAPEALKTMGMR